MYEADASTVRSHEDLYHERVVRTDADAFEVESILEPLSLTGVPLGMSRHPGDGWARLRWRSLADRLDVNLERQVVPPSTQWFPYRRWPASIQPPCEGSLDDVSLGALADVLRSHSQPESRAKCHYLHVPTLWWNSGLAHQIDTLERIPLFGEAETQRFSPTNFWPHDRTWFVYTDYDLCATKVSGSAALIAAVHDSADLETLDWEGLSDPRCNWSGLTR